MRPGKKKPISRNILSEKPTGKFAEKEKVYHFLVMTAAAAILMVIVKMASNIVAPVLMALFLTIILIVPLRWLRQKGLPNVVALIIVLGCTAVVFVGIGILVGQSLNEFVYQFPRQYRTKIVQKFESLDQKLKQYGFTLGLGKKEKKEDENLPENEHLPEIAPSGENDNIPDGITRPDTHEKDIPASTNAQPRQPDPEKEPDTTPLTNTNEPGAGKNAPKTEPSTNRSGNADLTDDKLDDLDNEPLDTWTEEEENAHKDENNPLDDDFFDVDDLSEHVFRHEQLGKTAKRNEPPSITELNPETVMYWLGKIVLELRHLAERSFLVMIITFFMIFEASRFPEKVDWAMGKGSPINKWHLHHIASEIRRYLFIKSISCVMSSAAATFVYWAFGVPGYLLWGLVAFFLYFIPNIGGIVAAIIPGLLIFMMMDLQGVFLYVVCLVTIECSIGYGIEPKMLGHGLGISTVVIFLSLLMWGWILGPVGLFLAAPLTIMVKIILQAFEETEWIAILLGDKDHPTPHDEI